HPMPHQLESYKLADASGVARRPWTIALLVGGAFAAFVTFWIFLHLMYTNGAAAKVGYAYGYATFAQIASWTRNPAKGDPAEWIATAWGFGLAAGMQWARLRFAWFTLHPLAYAVTSSYQMNIVWLPLTLAWMAKATLLRFGGLNAFRRALPFFFGLMLGQFVVGSLWNILGTWLNLPTYRFWD
ncbi:MAG: hypothetical protein H7Y38_08365, partial [Armatimonadetes bacterium]|nr:hypothetical protein [Armatimonadota bacterium]